MNFNSKKKIGVEYCKNKKENGLLIRYRIARLHPLTLLDSESNIQKVI